MARKANPTLIGVFVLGAAALAVAGVAYFGSGQLNRQVKKYVLYFEGSLQGLTVGSPVMFRGVRIGSVVEILVRYYADKQYVDTPVYIELETNRVEWMHGTDETGDVVQRMIDRGLRAQLVTQSFVTGLLAVQLDFHPDKPATFKDTDHVYIEIPTVPSAFDELTQTLQNLPIEELMLDLRTAVQGVDEFIRSPELLDAVKSFQGAAANIGKLAQNIDKQVDPVAASIQDMATQWRTALEQVNQRIAAAEQSLSETLAEYRSLAVNANEQIEPLAAGVRTAVQEAEAALKQSRGTLEEVQRSISRDSELHFRLISTLTDLGEAAQSVKRLADALEQRPESLLRGKQ